MAEVRPDDEIPGRTRFRTRSNHQNPTVRPLSRESSYNGGGNWVPAPWIWRLSAKYPLNYFRIICMAYISMFIEINVNLTKNFEDA